MPRSIAISVILLASLTYAQAQPAPGIGLLVKPADLPALREKIKSQPWADMFAHPEGRRQSRR